MEKGEFCTYIETYQRDMFRFAKSIVGTDADGEDAVQEAVLIAYEKIETLRAKRKFKAWIFRILLHECYKIIKRRERQGLTWTGEVPEQIYEESSQEETGIWGLLEYLPTEYREVIVLYYGDEFSVREIAGILGIPAGTVKSRLSRGRGRVKEMLNEERRYLYEGR